MKLYLLRHGEAMNKQENAQRPLNNMGIAEITRIAAHLKDLKAEFRHIYHSDKLRSEETAAIIARELEIKDGLSTLPSLNPDDEVQPLIKDVEALNENTLLVGHLPNLALLCNYLLNYDVNTPSVSFATGTLAILESQDTHLWVLKSIIDPAQLQPLPKLQK